MIFVQIIRIRVKFFQFAKNRLKRDYERNVQNAEHQPSILFIILLLCADGILQQYFS
jgi:hypothetical protein